MARHEQFLELCAAATAGELSSAESAKLDAHLGECPECRAAMAEYQFASQHGVAALASEFASGEGELDSSWSVAKAEESLFRRLDEREKAKASKEVVEVQKATSVRGGRFTYRPSQIRWRELWMPFAAALMLALALGITVYRSGMRRGADVARSTTEPLKTSTGSLEEQASDAGHDRALLLAKLTDEEKVIADLRRQVFERQKTINALKADGAAETQGSRNASESGIRKDEDLAAARTKLQELQKTIDTLSVQREELTSRAATLDARVGELTQLVRKGEREVDKKQEEVAKQQDLLDRDRDIRELMGARDLYIADVHDVAGTGQTNKTYGRVFYTRGKRLIFYAYDLDAEPGVKNASSFQAWGRKGPDKLQALNLGVFYEDNVGKKRWVLKTTDAKTLEDIDAVFVTVEPNGGSHHPSGKQLLFASLRISPNHP